MDKIIMFSAFLGSLITGTIYQSEKDTHTDSTNYIEKAELKEDFIQFRQILEREHCCLYEYTSKKELDSLFDFTFKLIEHPMKLEEFFLLLAPITAKIGCMHTATWMPGSFFETNAGNMFPLEVKFINDDVVVTGSYLDIQEIPVGSIILKINELPVAKVIEKLRQTTSSDALNPYFIDAQLTHRFSMFYASIFGFPEKYELVYALPGRKTRDHKSLSPANIQAVRKVVFESFNHPLLTLKILDEKSIAVLTVKTFVYYDRVDYFQNFMDSCFLLMKERQVKNLILDLRGNGGGDPFCAAILLSYLEKEPTTYFAGVYGRYAELANPVAMHENHFTGKLYTLLDGSCGSTNGHFCALLKYHRIGKFIGTPSGSTYKCNAGKDTEFTLEHSQLIITVGRSTFSAAVNDMDKKAPILPDVQVQETYRDFLAGRDLFTETAMEQIVLDNPK